MKKKEIFPFSLSLVIPLYNNEKTLVTQLNSCKKILSRLCDKFEIIVCEDKSIDSSKFLLQKNFGKDKRFKLLFNSKNKGIATTVSKLYKTASLDYVCIFSVDGDWNPKDISKLLLKIHETKADITIGKRNAFNYILHRKFISFMYNFLCWLLFGVNTIDAGSIKVFKRSLLKKIPIDSKSVFFEAEFIIRAAKRGYTISSCPVYFKKLDKHSGTGGRLRLIFSSFYDLLKLKFNL